MGKHNKTKTHINTTKHLTHTKKKYNKAKFKQDEQTQFNNNNGKTIIKNETEHSKNNERD